MEIILQKANFNTNEIKNYITKITVEELNNLSEPCHFPDWKKHYHSLIYLSNLTDDDIKKFSKRFYSETEIQKNLAKYGKIPKLLQDPGSNLLIILMHYFLKNKDVKTYSTIMIYYMIRQYGNLLSGYLSTNKGARWCKPEVFLYTLDHLNPTHLFRREKTISNALYHLANEENKKYTSAIRDLDTEKISKFIHESRSRISQSLRSFLEAYFRFNKEGLSINEPLKNLETGEDIYPEQLQKGTRIAELVANKICVYKELNIKAIEDSKRITKINMSLATLISNSLQDTSLTNDIKFIIELFLKDIPNVKTLCKNDFYPYLKQLMSIKRSSKTVFFKKEVNNLLLKILDKINYTKKYNNLTSQTQFQINSYLALYLTLYTRNVVC